MPPDASGPYTELARAARQVAEGDYRSASSVFELAHSDSQPELAHLAEVFGFMTVKVQAREYRLEKINAEIERAAQMRAEFGAVACSVLVLTCIYTLMLGVLQTVAGVNLKLHRELALVVSLISYVFPLVTFALYLRRIKPAPESFGWSIVNWRRHTVEATVMALTVAAVLLVIRWVGAHVLPAYRGMTVVDWRHWDSPFSMVMYVVLVPLQEIISRGFLQNSVERFLMTPRRRVIAIGLTSLQFGVVHLQFSVSTALLTMVGGVLFGVLFARQRTLVGVCVAHSILGVLAFGPLQLIAY